MILFRDLEFLQVFVRMLRRDLAGLTTPRMLVLERRLVVLQAVLAIALVPAICGLVFLAIFSSISDDFKTHTDPKVYSVTIGDFMPPVPLCMQMWWSYVEVIPCLNSCCNKLQNMKSVTHVTGMVEIPKAPRNTQQIKIRLWL